MTIQGNPRSLTLATIESA